MKNLTVCELQEQARELASLFPQTTLEQRTMFLMTEMGELVAEALYLSGAHGSVDAEAVKRRLGMEIYDVVWNLCDLANMLGIDLEAAFQRKMAINRQRTWPEAV